MTASASSTTSTTSAATTPGTPGKLVAQIAARQVELGITDAQLCAAVGIQKEIILKMIMQGSMMVPLTKVPAFAEALNLDPATLMRAAMSESSPELTAAIEAVYGPMRLTPTEVNLIKHLRKLAGDQPCSPIVFEGKAIVALVAA